MRYALFALAVAACGCYGESVAAPDDPVEEPGPEGTDVEIDPEFYNHPKTAELDTEKVRPIAKTIEWPGISTEEGASYLGDALVIDRIARDDSDGSYGVRIRVKNTTRQVVQGQWLIRFYTRQGGHLAGYVGGIGSQERWQGVVVEPFRTAVLTDFSRVIGAEGFRLFIKGGASPDGLPDDPAQKEERKAKRDAAAQKP
jgi:hypothetical protein